MCTGTRLPGRRTSSTMRTGFNALHSSPNHNANKNMTHSTNLTNQTSDPQTTTTTASIRRKRIRNRPRPHPPVARPDRPNIVFPNSFILNSNASRSSESKASNGPKACGKRPHEKSSIGAGNRTSLPFEKNDATTFDGFKTNTKKNDDAWDVPN